MRLMLTYGRIFVLALFVLRCGFASAADAPSESPFIVDVLGTSSGPLEKKLPSGVVISVRQTRDGFLWLGTLNGLVRFDGDRFKVFDESNTPGLPSDQIVFLYEDSRGWLWVGTDGGGIALIHDGVVGSLGFGAGSSAGKVMSACEDADGGVWFYTQDGQLGRFFGDGLTVMPVKNSQSITRSQIGRASCRERV